MSILTPKQAATYELLRGKLHALYRHDQFRIHERIVAFHDILKAHHRNAREFLLFHLISGSTFPGFNGCFDFLGADSVEHFIEREYLEAFPQELRPVDGGSLAGAPASWTAVA